MAGCTEGTALSTPAVVAPLVLASASPRRRDLLTAAGWEHSVQAADADETFLEGETALQGCERVAALKAATVASGLTSGSALGGDTIVVLDDEVLGKPVDREDAERMLRALSGRTHQVVSAVAIQRADGLAVSGLARSVVRFEPLDDAVVTTYLDGGEWQGKAGGYAIQGQGGAFARLEEGVLDTVIGLPMELVNILAEELGMLLQERETAS